GEQPAILDDELLELFSVHELEPIDDHAVELRPSLWQRSASDVLFVAAQPVEQQRPAGREYHESAGLRPDAGRPGAHSHRRVAGVYGRATGAGNDSDHV